MIEGTDGSRLPGWGRGEACAKPSVAAIRGERRNATDLLRAKVDAPTPDTTKRRFGSTKLKVKPTTILYGCRAGIRRTGWISKPGALRRFAQSFECVRPPGTVPPRCGGDRLAKLLQNAPISSRVPGRL